MFYATSFVFLNLVLYYLFNLSPFNPDCASPCAVQLISSSAYFILFYWLFKALHNFTLKGAIQSKCFYFKIVVHLDAFQQSFS